MLPIPLSKEIKKEKAVTEAPCLNRLRTLPSTYLHIKEEIETMSLHESFTRIRWRAGFVAHTTEFYFNMLSCLFLVACP